MVSLLVQNVDDENVDDDGVADGDERYALQSEEAKWSHLNSAPIRSEEMLLTAATSLSCGFA